MHKFIISGDGSHTLYHEELNETYHSTHGAIQESMHVFIEMGLQQIQEKEIKILEIGFGTGLNAFLTALHHNTHPETQIEYHTLEPFPLPESIYINLNFSEILKVNEPEKRLFQLIHDLEWEETVQLTEGFQLKKQEKKLEDFNALNSFYDIVFFDAFAPNKQKEIWSVDNLSKCYTALKDNGIFVTYCSQGQFRRNLESVGFKVNRIQGPPGKREMIRAFKN